MQTNNHIIERTSWHLRGFMRYTVAALPSILLGLAYCWPDAPFLPYLGLGSYNLARMVALEFLVIHSFPFLAIIGLIKPTKPSGRRWQAVIFWGLIVCYIILAEAVFGWSGVLYFAGLTGATYLGFFLHITKPRVVNQLVIRWGVNFIIYIFLAIVLDMPKGLDKWAGAHNVLTLGAIYFIGAGLVEWSGFYHMAWINRLPIAEGLSRITYLQKLLIPTGGTTGYPPQGSPPPWIGLTLILDKVRHLFLSG